MVGHSHRGKNGVLVGQSMAQLVSKIEYTPADVARMATIQQHMAAQLAEDINAEMERRRLTAAQAVEVLQFLARRLETGV